MTTIAKMHSGKLELPESVLRLLHLDADSSLLVELNQAEGTLTLRKIDPDQSWFWTPEWQAREREADQDLREGRFERFESDEDFLNSFE